MRRAWLCALLATPALALAAGALRADARALEIVRSERAPQVVDGRRALPEAPPPLRGWRAPLFGEPERVPWEAPGPEAPAGVRRAAALVQRELARAGLRATLARALVALAPQPQASVPQPQASVPEPQASVPELAEALARAGLPVDLLALLAPARDEAAPESERSGEPRELALVARLAARLAAGASEEELVAEAARASFRAEPPTPAFRAAAECGEQEIALVRAQLSRADPWLGPRDGGNLDLVRQVVAALPEAALIASVAEEHAAELVDELGEWPAEAPRTLCVEPLAVSQWAQDCAEPGWARAADGALEPAVLVPRYATRGERGAHAPGESFLVETLARAGLRVVRSRLLFQGGNVLVVHDPLAGERLAVVGEAELLRNVALGLSLNEVLEQLRAELAVERCMVLPAVAFHVDQELSFRVVDGALLAFVHEAEAGARAVLAIALEALARAGRVEGGRAQAAREALDAGASAPARALLHEALDAAALEPGTWPRSFAALFSTGAEDPGEPNLDLVLSALEQADSADPAAIEAAEPFRAALLRSWARTRADRALVAQALAARGWRVVAVPGLPGQHGLDYLNALHAPERTLLPAYGGLWEPLDRAAQAAWRAALPEAVELLAVRAAESQRRQGALHCSIALHPRAPR